MTELIIGAGDTVSRLLQTIAKDVGLKDVRWSGKGDADIRAIMVELYNTRLARDTLWVGLKDLYDMPELKTLPESLQAKLASIILLTRANFELKLKN